MQKIRWFLLILCAVTGLVLVAQNNDPASVKFLTIERIFPMSVLLLSAGGIGFLLGALMTASMLRNRKKAAKRKQIEAETKLKREARQEETPRADASNTETPESQPSDSSTDAESSTPLG